MTPFSCFVSLGLTRSVRWVFNATLNTQRALRVVVEICSSIGVAIDRGRQGVHSIDMLRGFK